jgi:carotenoid cleavage dioxygenase-like enzyme
MIEPRPVRPDDVSFGNDPYLNGNYRPVQDEITADLEVVAGELPDDLAGVFARVGSNPRFVPKGRYHWFDGDGMIHAVHFAGGRAVYRNRWVRTAAFLAEEEAGECLWTGIREPPDTSNPGGPFKDTANTDLVFHAGKLLALWWLGGTPYVIGLPDLDTRGPERFGGKLPAGLSAHPKLDPRTGELVVFDYKPFPPYLSYGVIDAGGDLVHWTAVDLPGPRSQHDVAITERFSILMDMSMMPDMSRGGRTIFDRSKPTRFGLLPRRGAGSEVRWFETSPCFMYHTINAWEDGDRVVLVGCRIADPLDRDPHAPPRPGDERIPRIGFLRLEPYLWRWTFDLGTGSVREEQLDDVLGEFPRMNDLRLGVPTRYAYSQRIDPGPTLLFDGVIKYDTETSRSWVHAYPEGWFGGETVFAPRSGDSEDDGYLVTFVVEETTGASECWVLDAARIADPPVVRLAVPQRVPTGYHTWWMSAGDLARQAS